MESQKQRIERMLKRLDKASKIMSNMEARLDKSTDLQKQLLPQRC